MIETNYALLQIINAGARVFFYAEDKEATLDSPIDKIMASLTAFGDELQRERARVHTRDAHMRIARSGRVTGGACFGYRNEEVLGPEGRRTCVERRILDDEADVVRRIFRMCAEGIGFTTIAKTLNAEGAAVPEVSKVVRRVGPRPQCARSCTVPRIEEKWSGTEPQQRECVVVGAKFPSPKTFGFECRRRTSASSPMKSGTRHTRGSAKFAGAISVSRMVKCSAVRPRLAALDTC
jgi:hypothetical protein